MTCQETDRGSGLRAFFVPDFIGFLIAISTRRVSLGHPIVRRMFALPTPASMGIEPTWLLLLADITTKAIIAFATPASAKGLTGIADWCG
jgi:hypothetical protein